MTHRLCIFSMLSALLTIIFAVPLAHSGDSLGITAVKVEGTVLFNQKSIKSGDQLTGKGTLLADGKKSFVDIKFEGGHVMRLRNGQMTLTPPKKKAVVRIDLKRGKLFNFINRKSKKPSFRFHTKPAIMGVRGTKFMIEATPQKTYLCVCEGTVMAWKPGKKKKQVPVKKGQDLWAYPDKPIGVAVNSSDMMFNMVADEFTGMGFPVKTK